MGFDEGGFQVGMLFGDFRTELGAVFGTSSGTVMGVSGSLTHLAILVKAAYDFQVAPGLSMYPIIGFGLAHTFKTIHAVYGSMTGGSMDKSYNDFIYLFGAGTTVAINNKTSLSLEYDYLRSTGKNTIIFNGQPLYIAENFGRNGFSLRWNRLF